MLERIWQKVESRQRLNRAEAVFLDENASLHELGWLAQIRRRQLHPDDGVTYVVDRNINYTNVCVSGCRFCAFYRNPGDPDAYVLGREEIIAKTAATVAAGGTGILLQGGLHPGLDLPYFESLLRDLRERFSIDLHCFSPPEILHISRISGVTIETCLRRLMAAGLSSLPGGGAEILSDGIRSRISPRKCTAAEWLMVMETAHRSGLSTTATMMSGCGETLLHRLEHLDLLRSLQDRFHGFTAFIPWTFQPGHTGLEETQPNSATAVEYLRLLALSRLYLDNIPALQASWVTQGLKVAQTALFFGADDLGSVMMEENVVAAAGVTNRTDEAELRHVIGAAGFRPVRRNNRHQRLQPA